MVKSLTTILVDTLQGGGLGVQQYQPQPRRKRPQMQAVINLKQRMLNKSIIDANASVRKFLAEETVVSYDDIPVGGQNGVLIPAVFPDGTETKIKFYRRPRGDRQLWIKKLGNHAKDGDTVTISRSTQFCLPSANGSICNQYLQIGIEAAA